MSDQPRIIVALDFPSAEEALVFSDRVDPSLCRLKVGKELFTSAGPQLVKELVNKGFDIFLDLKFHDIPATVAKACAAAANLGVWMLNVHASGGLTMMREARKAVPKDSGVLLIGVTVLTSMDDEDLRQVGIDKSADEQVKLLADLVDQAGLDGLVCSAREARSLKSKNENRILVTPGIRPSWAGSNDQKRIVTPKNAVDDGADYLVIGRPITQAEDPKQALKKIIDEIN